MAAPPLAAPALQVAQPPLPPPPRRKLRHCDVVEILPFLPADCVVCWSKCSLGCRSTATAELRRRGIGMDPESASLRWCPPAARQQFAILRRHLQDLFHQDESSARSVASASPAMPLPGMSWEEAASAHDVSVSWPTTHMSSVEGVVPIQWRATYQPSLRDGSAGGAVGIAESSGFFYVSYLAYVNMQHSGVPTLVIIWTYDRHSCETVDVYWRIRDTDNPTMTRRPQDRADVPLSSTMDVFGQLVRCDLDLSGADPSEEQKVPIDKCRPFSIFEFAARGLPPRSSVLTQHRAMLLVLLMTAHEEPPDCVASMSQFPSNVSPKAAQVSAFADCQVLSLITDAVKRVTQPIFAYRAIEETLNTPKGMFTMDGQTAGLRLVRDLPELWTFRRRQVQMFFHRGWDRGLSRMWENGWAPIGCLLECIANTASLTEGDHSTTGDDPNLSKSGDEDCEHSLEDETQFA